MKRVILALATVGVLYTGIAAGAHAASGKKDPACTIGPNPASIYQAYTISAIGLPTTTPDYLIVSRPDGTSYYYGGGGNPIAVNSNGTWSGTDAVSLAGTWTYTFSGVLTNNKYGTVATCTVQVG